MGTQLFRNEANFIKSMITHPCARPWFIYLETFLPAFIKLLITVVLFDVEDAIRAHGETITKDKKGGKGKRHTPRIKTQGQPKAIDRYAQKGLKVLLVVTSPLEKIGFTWLVFSAVDRFFYDWQTLLENSDFCVDRGQAGPLTRGRGPGFVSIVESFIPVILTNLLQDRGGWDDGPIAGALPQGRFTAVFALTVIGPLFGAGNIIIRIRTPGAFGSTTTESEPLALGQDEEGSMIVVHNFFLPLVGGGSITWEIGGETIPIGINTVKGHMTVFKDLP